MGGGPSPSVKFNSTPLKKGKRKDHSLRRKEKQRGGGSFVDEGGGKKVSDDSAKRGGRRTTAIEGKERNHERRILPERTKRKALSTGGEIPPDQQKGWGKKKGVQPRPTSPQEKGSWYHDEPRGSRMIRATAKECSKKT